MPRAASLFSLFVSSVVALAVLVCARDARAASWVELHVARDDIRVEMDAAGKATVEHRMVLLVNGGPLKELVVRGVDEDAEIDSDAWVALEKDAAGGTPSSPLAAEPKKIDAKVDDGAPARSDVVIALNGGAGIARGRYVAVLRYRTDLRASGALAEDGASARIRWTGALWDDGLDTTKATFVLPRAPTEPRPFDEPDGADASDGDDGASFLSTLTRRPTQDALEVVRPYAPRGERTVWTVRADKRAFDMGAPLRVAREPLAPLPERVDPLPTRLGSVKDGVLFALAALALLVLASTVAAHASHAKRIAEERDQVARPLVPLPIAVRAVLAALFWLGGGALGLVFDAPLAGAITAALFVPMVWHRTARQKPSPRPPGQWLPVTRHEALRSDLPIGSASPFDLGRNVGRVSLSLFVLLVAGGVYFVGRRSGYAAVLLALDALPLTALFFSGLRRRLIADLALSPAPLLDAVVKRVEKKSKRPLRVIPRIRVPRGQADADEVRIVLLPKDPLRGLKGVEIGASPVYGPGGTLLLPEILVRCEDGSPAATALARAPGYGKLSRGRRADECVLAVSPKIPTARTTADLALALLDRLASAQHGRTA